MKPLIVVSSAIANKPDDGGNARMVLNWLQGLVTVDQRVGSVAWPIPTNAISWVPIRQPIVLDDCHTSAAASGAFTTIASWRGAYRR